MLGLARGETDFGVGPGFMLAVHASPGALLGCLLLGVLSQFKLYLLRPSLSSRSCTFPYPVFSGYPLLPHSQVTRSLLCPVFCLMFNYLVRQHGSSSKSAWNALTVQRICILVNLAAKMCGHLAKSLLDP